MDADQCFAIFLAFAFAHTLGFILRICDREDFR